MQLHTATKGGKTHEQYVKNVYIVINKNTAFSGSRSYTQLMRAECAHRQHLFYRVHTPVHLGLTFVLQAALPVRLALRLAVALQTLVLQ